MSTWQPPAWQLPFYQRLWAAQGQVWQLEVGKASGERIAQARRIEAHAFKELEMATLTDKAKEIRAKYRSKIDEAAQNLRTARAEAADETLPSDYRAKRQDQTVGLAQQLNHWMGVERAEMDRWYQASITETERMYATEPPGDTAAETRRLRQQMQISTLAERYQGKTMAKNHLASEARRLLNLGVLDEARVYHEASKQAGYTDPMVDREINWALDVALPQRRAALDSKKAVVLEYERHRVDQARERVLNGVARDTDKTIAAIAEWGDTRTRGT